MMKVTCALIFKNGKVLVTQNGEDSDHPLQWEFPGGKINPGESGPECIVREIREELELDIGVAGKLEPVEHDYGIKQIELIPFVCRIRSGTIKLNHHIDKKWIEIHELEKIDLSEADRVLVQKNKNELKKYSGKEVDKP